MADISEKNRGFKQLDSSTSISAMWSKFRASLKANKKSDNEGGDDSGSGGFALWRFEGNEAYLEQQASAEHKDVELVDAGTESEDATSELQSKANKDSQKIDHSDSKESSTHSDFYSSTFYEKASAQEGAKFAEATSYTDQGTNLTNIGVSWNHTGKTQQSGGHAGRLFANVLDNNVVKQTNVNTQISPNPQAIKHSKMK